MKEGAFRAFPSSAIDDRLGGMELRDWFAGLAMSAYCQVDSDDAAREIAADAYRIADAMMAARGK